MNLELEVSAPEGMVVEDGFVRRISEVLRRAEVPFEVEDGDLPKIRLTGASDAESRYVLRILQRQGYTVRITET